MSKQSRKRRHNNYEPEVEIIAPRNKFKSLSEYDRAEETKLSEVLFGGATSFLQSLEEAEQEAGPSSVNVDSGIGETDSDGDRCPAWVDEDDDIDVGIALNSQKRRLPNGGINSRSNEYKKLLKHKFETIVGKPKWASLDKKDEEDSDSDSEILRTCGFISKKIKSHLPESSLEYKKVKDLNYRSFADGAQVNVIEYHPTSSVSLIGGSTGIATLFAVDGRENSKLHNVAFQKFPIYCAKFIHGNNIILGSRHNYIYNYDLMTTTATRATLPDNITHCKYFITSLDGKYLAVAGRLGEIHLLSSATHERITLLKQDHSVSSLCFNPQGNLLYGHSTTGEVTVWDINMQRPKYKWIDDGCIHGTNITISDSNQFLATGSAEGVVNVYNTAEVMLSKTPKPKKIVRNLTTGINDLKFNSSSEILALSSLDIDTSVRLLHLGSMTVFNNFPSFGSKLGHITVFNFSPGSGYLALGNRKSSVSLYRLKHYTSY